MHRISIAIAAAIVFLASVASGQQATSTSSLPPSPTIGGGGTPNYIPIWTSSTDLGNSLIYQTNGNVGIGTTSPSAALDVNGNVRVTAAYQIQEFTVLASPGSGNVFVGPDAGSHTNNTGAPANTFVGGGAGFDNTSGSNNTFIGNGAGTSNTTSGSNTFLGWAAGYYNTGGQQNTFLGALAGTYNTAGVYDTFVGAGAGETNTTGHDDTFVGINAGFANTTGGNNSFFGPGAGFTNSTGNLNTYVGNGAGASNSEGSNNTFLGALAGLSSTNGSNNIYIGSQGCSYPCSESGAIRIGGGIGQGHGPQTAAYIGGIFGATSSSGVPVYINAFGQLGISPSSVRFKQQVRDMGDNTDALMKLRPVTFLYKPEYANGERTLQYGLIAEEVAKVYPELVAYDNDGKPYSVRYQYLSTMLLNEVQKQYRRAEQQAQVLASQQEEIKSQQLEIESLKLQLQVQNASMIERLSRLEKQVASQDQTIAQK